MKQEDNNIQINEQQERFCQEYCIDLNATQAAIRAGYSEKTSYSIGSRLLKVVEIQARIKEIQADLSKATNITQIKQITELEKVAYANIAHLYSDWMTLKEFESIPDEIKAAIKAIDSKEITKHVGDNKFVEKIVKITLHDKIKAIETINTMLGFNAATKQEVKHEVDGLQIIVRSKEAGKSLDKIINGDN